MAVKDLTRTFIRPQPGPQEAFLASPADIVIYGGSAGSGKTFALLMEALRHTDNPHFGAVIFRRESTQITNEGGLWDSSMKLYPIVGATPYRSPKLGFAFPSRARITFGHLNQETDVLNWQGSSIALLCFDELTHFTRSQFFYMLSRNRSDCGVRPYVRATTNPDADSWVAKLIEWWIDQNTGFPINERAGAVRYFVRVDDKLRWADSAQALANEYGIDKDDAKSVTFIPASIYDNAALMRIDPGYLSNLKALARVERERLLDGNWKVRPAAGMYFPRHNANILDAIPADVETWVRAWDLAATPTSEANQSPDATAGVRIGVRPNGRYVVSHAVLLRAAAHQVRQAIHATAKQDGTTVRVVLPQDPGQAGKDQGQSLVSSMPGYYVTLRRPTGDKITRAEPFAAQWQAGNVDIVWGAWNEDYLSEMEAFPSKGVHDDQVDASSDAFASLAKADIFIG